MAQVTVKRNNKVLNIEDTRLDSYLLQGYDQINKNGAVVAKATGGRTVSLAEHNKVFEELNKTLEENEELKKEITTLKGKLTKAENALEAAKEPKK